MKMESGITLASGQAIYLHEIETIAAVTLPEINGERIAFVYLFFNGFGYQIIFDFSPNVPDEMMSKDEKEKGALSISQAIAESLQAVLVERVIHIHDSSQEQLQKIGLWAAPALLPYPLSKIIRQIEEDDIKGARNTLVRYCTPQYIEQISSKWWAAEQFDARKNLLKDALHAHETGMYGLSIHALLPQVEGIITDWVYENLPANEAPPWRTESKTKKFLDLTLEEPLTTFTYRRIVESAIDFILSGPVLETFKKWNQLINEAFPNRHVVGHGRYEESLFSEENSIKLVLLLDTIYHIITSHEQSSLPRKQ